MKITCTMSEWLAYGPGIVANAGPNWCVDISDKEPAILRGAKPAYTAVYHWFAEDDEARCKLPPEIIAGQGIDDGFRSKIKAKDWLSNRCIQWAKDKAKEETNSGA